MTIGTPRLCIVLVNTRGVRSDGVKDNVFHAQVNLRIPLSDRQEKSYPPPLPQLSKAALLIRDALRVCPACVNDVLSCIPPFAMYMSGINRASLEAKTLYIDRYFDSDIPMTRKSRTAWLLDLKFGLNDACICPPAVQMELKFVDFRVKVTLSPFVLAYYLTFLCYHELRQYDDRDRALRHVVDVVNDLYQRGNEFYRSMNITGHCLLMVGETSRARDMFIRSYEVTLRNPPFERYNSALYYLQCLFQ